MWMVFGLFITPSLTYFAQLASRAGVHAFGVVYGIYNVAWAVGLMAGPTAGGFLFDRFGFARLTIGWSIALVVLTMIIRGSSPRFPSTHVR
jgi:MFS family permease